LLAAVLAATNPSRADFVESIRQLTSKGLGQWAGQLCIIDLNAAKCHDADYVADDGDLVADCVICMLPTTLVIDQISFFISLVHDGSVHNAYQWLHVWLTDDLSCAGGIVGSLFGLNQSTSKTSLNISNFFLFSFAEYHSYYFVGVFGMWIPLDPKLFMFWLVAHSTCAWKIAQQFLGRDFGSMQWVQQNLSNPGWLWQAAQRFLQQQL